MLRENDPRSFQKNNSAITSKSLRGRIPSTLSVVTGHLECVGTMPTADELYEALFNAHNHSQTQKRLVLHIEEARERQRDS